MPDRPDVRPLAAEMEDDTYLGCCDWGSCPNQQVGWARCECDECRQYDTGWLPICNPCRKRGTSKDAPGAHPVAEFVSFAAVWREVDDHTRPNGRNRHPTQRHTRR